MALLVQKYGGTSVADADRIRAVAEHISFTKRQGHDVIAVVSAMGKDTDGLIALAREVSSVHPGREMDMLLTAGERKSMSLLCMALADMDVSAKSFTGSQVGIITDNDHGRAKILEVKGDRVRDAISEGTVCVVAGFQGQSLEREITTLGRGGSDTTAVALAAAWAAAAEDLVDDLLRVLVSRVVTGHDDQVSELVRMRSHRSALAGVAVAAAAEHAQQARLRTALDDHFTQGAQDTGQRVLGVCVVHQHRAAARGDALQPAGCGGDGREPLQCVGGARAHQ